MTRFKYHIMEWDAGKKIWQSISQAEGEPKILAIGLRAMADLIDPQPTLAESWAEVKKAFSWATAAEAMAEGAKHRDPFHTPGETDMFAENEATQERWRERFSGQMPSKDPDPSQDPPAVDTEGAEPYSTKRLKRKGDTNA